MQHKKNPVHNISGPEMKAEAQVKQHEVAESVASVSPKIDAAYGDGELVAFPSEVEAAGLEFLEFLLDLCSRQVGEPLTLHTPYTSCNALYLFFFSEADI